MARRTTRTGRELKPDVERTVREYCRVLINAKLSLDQVLVFGSQANGTARADSDIDIAVVSSNFGKDYHEELGYLLKLRRSVSLLIEPHPFHPDDLNDRWSTLASEVREYGIPID